MPKLMPEHVRSKALITLPSFARSNAHAADRRKIPNSPRRLERHNWGILLPHLLFGEISPGIDSIDN